MKLRVGISPCPNDTFAFHAILERCIDMRGFELDVELVDVQRLNDGLFAGHYDVAKASFHAALLLSDRIVPMTGRPPAGLAAGRGTSLGAAVTVELRRPRSANDLVHDDCAARVRAKVVASLTEDL